MDKCVKCVIRNTVCVMAVFCIVLGHYVRARSLVHWSSLLIQNDAIPCGCICMKIILFSSVCIVNSIYCSLTVFIFVQCYDPALNSDCESTAIVPLFACSKRTLLRPSKASFLDLVAIKKVIEFRRFLSLENQLQNWTERRSRETHATTSAFFCPTLSRSHAIWNVWHFIYALNSFVGPLSVLHSPSANKTKARDREKKVIYNL